MCAIVIFQIADGHADANLHQARAARLHAEENIKDSKGGKAVSRDRLAARLTSRLLPLLIGRSEDFFTPDSLMEYRRRSLVIGQNIRVIQGGTEYPARATGITDAGALSIVREDGSQETLSTGEITVRLR